MGKICCGKSAGKILKWIKHYIFCFEYVWENSEMDKTLHSGKILKWIKHYIFVLNMLFSLFFNNHRLKFLVRHNEENTKTNKINGHCFVEMTRHEN